MRNSLIYLLIAVAAIALILLLFRQGDNAQTIPFNRVVEMARDNTGPALNIEVNGDTVKIDNGSQVFSSRKETSTSVFESLSDAGADLNNLPARCARPERPRHAAAGFNRILAADLVRRTADLHAAPSPSRQQPDHELRSHPRPNVRRRQGYRHILRRGRRPRSQGRARRDRRIP